MRTTNKKTTYRIEICINQDWFDTKSRKIHTRKLARQKLFALIFKYPKRKYRLIKTNTIVSTYIYESEVK